MKIQFDTPPISAEASNGVSVKYSAARHRAPRWRWYLLLSVVLALPLFLLLRVVWGVMLESTPALVMQEQLVLRAPIAAQVQMIVEENILVQDGDALARLEPYGGNPPPAETQVLQSALSLAKERLQILRQQLRRQQTLQRQGAATLQEVEAIRLQWLQAQEQASVIQRDLLVNTARQPDATAVELLSPAPANVTRRFMQQGEWVQAGDELLVLQTGKDTWIQAFLAPEQIKFATPGQKATLVFMNGYHAPAIVEKVLQETQRMPSERAESLRAQPPSALVVHLKSLQPLPTELNVHRLPLNVRFTPRWPWD
ncbi:MAG: HlyD family secretion protein [Zoogloeaceae bacterium]|jgi:multidrug resistance efflux pump|nr:HlyD family secretion protein [Zoogloeaceae bacterium]